MQTAKHTMLSVSEAEGLAHGCVILAATARTIGASLSETGARGESFTELADVLEARAGILRGDRRRGQAAMDHRSPLRLVQE